MCVHHLTLLDVGINPAGVFVSDVVMVEDIGLIFSVSATSIGDCGDGSLVVHGPSNLIHDVDALLNERAAIEPLKVLPVTGLEFHIAHAFGLLGGVGKRGNRAGQIGSVDRNHAAEVTGVNLFEELAVGRGISPAVSVLDGRAFLFGHLSGLDD